MEDDKVTFFFRDHADGSKRKTMTLDAHEFLRRFLLHVLPDGFVKIRYAGLLANSVRKTNLEICRRLLKAPEKPDPLPETWQESLLRVSGLDVTLCPICHGTMRTDEVIRPLRGPPW